MSRPELRAQMAAQKIVGRRVTVVAKGQRVVGIVCRATLALAAQERDGVQYKAGDLTRCRVATTHGVYSVRAIERVTLAARGSLEIRGRLRPVVTEVRS
jgi:hypothetical protein